MSIPNEENVGSELAESNFGDAKIAPEHRESEGPFDLSEVPAIRPYVDLGSLKVLPREGLALRLDVEEGSQRLVALSLDYLDSTLQVQAFSAPKSSGVWGSILNQTRTQLAAQGASAELVQGYFGPELLAELAAADGGAPQVMRFIGVDGPRWVLRGIVTGAANSDAKVSAAIDELFKSLVVVRGDMPMPPRELLPLRVPANARAE